jgi:prepilin-type N-terminal cleavage/methylation domain-containing protein
MKRYFRGRLRSLRHGDSGFTLVELLVVVGIIVALAAVIIPNVASFANRGEQGAEAAEFDNVQAAMDTMMADKNIISVTASTGGPGTNGWIALPLPSGNELFGGTTSYMRAATTTYSYCWDTTGLITAQGGGSVVIPTCP